MNEFNESEIQPVSEINTAEKQTIQQSNPEWDEIILKAYDGLPDEFKLAAQNFKVANGKTGVLVTYMPFPGPPIGVCHVTIYTATGPRHPVSAEVEQMIPGGWKPLGYCSINNYAVGTKSSIAPEITKFIFDCPAPQQYWEIHIETAVYNPLPNYLDSMIGSCETRAFIIVYPGVIAPVKQD